MNLRQLQYFVTVAEELHFGRAADRLHMSQPPLSQQIIALEESLGVQLFERTKRSVQLTPVGLQWLPEVRQVLASAAELPDKARRLSRGEIGTLRLAFVSTADYGVLPGLLQHYRSQHPEVQVTLQEATSDVQIDALLNKEIDVGIVIPPRGMSLPKSLRYLPLRKEGLVVALPQSWIRSRKHLLQGGQIDFNMLLDEPLIVFPRQSAPAFHDSIADYYTAHHATPRIGQEAIQMQTIISLVSVGMGIALVPASLQNLQRTGVVYAQLKGTAPEIETGLLWRRGQETVALDGLIAAAKTMAPGERPRATSGSARSTPSAR